MTIRKHQGPVGLQLNAVGSLGFTGTQQGVTSAQFEALEFLVAVLCPVEVHHGDCVGADEEFHRIVREIVPDAEIIIHPPVDSSRRAFCKGDDLRRQKEYLNRNRDIVSESDELIAVPKNFKELKRSGTWATVRYARKAGIPIYIVFPDGEVREE